MSRSQQHQDLAVGEEGILPARTNPLDGRERLIRMDDPEKLKQQGQGRPYFVSDGMANVPRAPRAAEIEEYLRSHWRP